MCDQTKESRRANDSNSFSDIVGAQIIVRTEFGSREFRSRDDQVFRGGGFHAVQATKAGNC